jgi:TRAP-type C4-dicarboxylate transport system permease small subunit
MTRLVVTTLDWLLAWLCGATLLAMMFLTFVDVIGRYFLSRPVVGAFELTEILLAITVFSAIPAVTRRDKHIKLDFLDPVLPPAAREMLDRIAAVLMVGVLLLLSYAVWGQAAKMQAAGLRTDIIGFPTFIVAYLVSVQLALSALFLIARMAVGDESAVEHTVPHE